MVKALQIPSLYVSLLLCIYGIAAQEGKIPGNKAKTLYTKTKLKNSSR
jgi:hypothetical protein